jgi:hypothetical protein
VFVVATILVAVCLVPAFLLPRHPPAARGDADTAAAATLMH